MQFYMQNYIIYVTFLYYEKNYINSPDNEAEADIPKISAH